MEMIEWFRWRLRKKRRRIQERSSIPNIRLIKIPSKSFSRRFTAAQDGLRKQFPGLAEKDWQEKIIGVKKK